MRLISSKTGNREHLEMLLNAFNQPLNEKVADLKKKTKAQAKYLLLLRKYKPEIINKAKRLLRTLIFIRFNPRWIHFEAQKERKFAGTAQ